MVRQDTEDEFLLDNDHITFAKNITTNGSSLCVNMTHEAGLLGLRAGDKVKITITRVRD